MNSILTLISLCAATTASSQYNDDAAGYPVQIPEHVVNPSPYGYQNPPLYYPIGRENLPIIPAYTSLLKDFDDASDDIKSHL